MGDFHKARPNGIRSSQRGLTPIGTVVGIALVIVAFLAIAGGAYGFGWWSWAGTFGTPNGAIIAGVVAVGLSALGVALIEKA